MKSSEDPSYDGKNVKVEFDLARSEIVIFLPGYTEPDGEEVAATVLGMTPAEAVELAGGITAVAVTATTHLLAQRAHAGQTVERVTDSGTPL